MKDKGPNPDLA